jgi:hypothetical protein
MASGGITDLDECPNIADQRPRQAGSCHGRSKQPEHHQQPACQPTRPRHTPPEQMFDRGGCPRPPHNSHFYLPRFSLKTVLPAKRVFFMAAKANLRAVPRGSGWSGTGHLPAGAEVSPLFLRIVLQHRRFQ